MVLTLMKNIWCSTRTGLIPRYVHSPPVSQASLGSLTFNTFGVLNVDKLHLPN